MNPPPYLTRTLQHAQIVGSPTSQTVVDTSIEQGADVAAGVRQQLEGDSTPRSRGGDAAAILARFVEDIKASGFVAAAVQRHGIQGASVAPAA